MNIPGPVLITFSATLWAVDGFLRQSLYTLDPKLIVFFEHLFGTLLILPFAFGALRSVFMPVSDVLLMLFISLTSGLIGTLWFTESLSKVHFISISVVFLLQKLQPIFAIATARIVLGEKMPKNFGLFAALALFGAYFVTFPTGLVKLDTGDQTNVAALLAFGTSFLWGMNTALSKKILMKYSVMVVTSLRFIFTTCFGFMLIYMLGKVNTLATPTPMQFGTFFIIALSTGMVALYLYYKGLKKTKASVSTILELTFPFLVVIMDVIFRGTKLTLLQCLGSLLLTIGMYKIAQKSYVESLYEPFVSTITKGKGRGKFLGFPTINVKIPESLSMLHGIYAASVQIGKKNYKGALHFGPIPFYQSTEPSLEFYLLDTSDDDLPKDLSTVQFIIQPVRRLRDIQNFSSEKALQKQIALDVAQVRKLI